MEITATKPCTSPHSTTSRATDLNKRLMDLTSPEYIIVSWTKLIHERRGHIGTQRGGAYQDPIPTWVEEYYFKGNYKTARIPDGYGQVPQDFYFTVSCRCQLSGHSWVALATAGRKIYSVVLEYKTWKILVSRLDLD